MSRVAKKPLQLPKGVDLTLADNTVTVKGPKGSLSMQLHADVTLKSDDGVWHVADRTAKPSNVAIAGTVRALLGNMVKGVSEGFERKLELVGVGYRAASQGKTLNLTLGFSHPVAYPVPEGITIETPSQTEVLIKGIDKQRVGQVAAEIRAYRPPEPYKGKGVRYSTERVVLKEAKKK